jgi:hypothetical protein
MRLNVLLIILKCKSYLYYVFEFWVTMSGVHTNMKKIYII